jgi:hypothetical protein
VAGVTVVMKYDEQSAVPGRVGKAEPRIAGRDQLNGLCFIQPSAGTNP